MTAPMNIVMKAPEGILSAVCAAYFREKRRNLIFFGSGGKLIDKKKLRVNFNA